MYCREIKNLVLRKWREDKASLSKIAKELKIPRSSVQYIIKPKLKNGKKNGRRPKTNERGLRKIRRDVIFSIKRNEKVTAMSLLKKNKMNISLKTMQRNLKRISASWEAVKKKIILTDFHKQQRVRICKEWLQKRINFSSIIFTDESKFNLDGPDNLCSWSYGKNKIQRNLRSMNGGGVMVLGALCCDGTLYLEFVEDKLNSTSYVEMLERKIIPSLKNKYRNGFIYQQDGAPCHTSNYSKEFFHKNNITLLTWPSKSPDLNLIEHVWSIFGQHIYDGTQIYNRNQLKNRILAAMVHYQKNYAKNVSVWFENYFQRVMNVIEKNGEFLNC